MEQMMKNGSDAFERALKDSLESYEVPFNSADWAQLEKALNKNEHRAAKSSLGLLALLFGGSLTIATAIYLVAVSEGEGRPTAALAVVEGTAPPTTEAPAIEAAQTMPGDASGTAVNAGAATPASTTAPKTGTTTTRTLATQPLESKPSSPLPPSTEVAIRPSVLEGCPGASVEFTADNLPSEGTFLWNFGDGSFSRDARPKHTFSKSGRFEVMLSHSSVGGGTIQNKPVSDVIVIHEVPEAIFTVLKQEYENTIPSVHFENRSIGGKTYAWDFGDGTTSNLMVPRHVYKKSGVYTVSLLVTNSTGCTDRMEKTVRIEDDYNLLASKSFSPNGDGLEDSFMPEALKTLGVRFHMTVHNGSTGELVYETSDAQKPWNGRVGGRGEACPGGDYIWMVEMKDGEKLGGTYNGTVSLLR
jgi:PKD repeat protein